MVRSYWLFREIESLRLIEYDTLPGVEKYVQDSDATEQKWKETNNKVTYAHHSKLGTVILVEPGAMVVADQTEDRRYTLVSYGHQYCSASAARALRTTASGEEIVPVTALAHIGPTKEDTNGEAGDTFQHLVRMWNHLNKDFTQLQTLASIHPDRNGYPSVNDIRDTANNLSELKDLNIRDQKWSTDIIVTPEASHLRHQIPNQNHLDAWFALPYYPQFTWKSPWNGQRVGPHTLRDWMLSHPEKPAGNHEHNVQLFVASEETLSLPTGDRQTTLTRPASSLNWPLFFIGKVRDGEGHALTNSQIEKEFGVRAVDSQSVHVKTHDGHGRMADFEGEFTVWYNAGENRLQAFFGKLEPKDIPGFNAKRGDRLLNDYNAIEFKGVGTENVDAPWLYKGEYDRAGVIQEIRHLHEKKMRADEPDEIPFDQLFFERVIDELQPGGMNTTKGTRKVNVSIQMTMEGTYELLSQENPDWLEGIPTDSRTGLYSRPILQQTISDMPPGRSHYSDGMTAEQVELGFWQRGKEHQLLGTTLQTIPLDVIESNGEVTFDSAVQIRLRRGGLKRLTRVDQLFTREALEAFHKLFGIRIQDAVEDSFTDPKIFIEELANLTKSILDSGYAHPDPRVYLFKDMVAFKGKEVRLSDLGDFFSLSEGEYEGRDEQIYTLAKLVQGVMTIRHAFRDDETDYLEIYLKTLLGEDIETTKARIAALLYGKWPSDLLIVGDKLNLQIANEIYYKWTERVEKGLEHPTGPEWLTSKIGSKAIPELQEKETWKSYLRLALIGALILVVSVVVIGIIMLILTGNLPSLTEMEGSKWAKPSLLAGVVPYIPPPATEEESQKVRTPLTANKINRIGAIIIIVTVPILMVVIVNQHLNWKGIEWAIMVSAGMAGYFPSLLVSRFLVRSRSLYNRAARISILPILFPRTRLGFKAHWRKNALLKRLKKKNVLGLDPENHRDFLESQLDQMIENSLNSDAKQIEFQASRRNGDLWIRYTDNGKKARPNFWLIDELNGKEEAQFRSSFATLAKNLAKNQVKENKRIWLHTNRRSMALISPIEYPEKGTGETEETADDETDLEPSDVKPQLSLLSDLSPLQRGALIYLVILFGFLFLVTLGPSIFLFFFSIPYATIFSVLFAPILSLARNLNQFLSLLLGVGIGMWWVYSELTTESLGKFPTTVSLEDELIQGANARAKINWMIDKLRTKKDAPKDLEYLRSFLIEELLANSIKFDGGRVNLKLSQNEKRDHYLVEYSDQADFTPNRLAGNNGRFIRKAYLNGQAAGWKLFLDGEDKFNVTIYIPKSRKVNKVSSPKRSTSPTHSLHFFLILGLLIILSGVVLHDFSFLSQLLGNALTFLPTDSQLQFASLSGIVANLSHPTSSSDTTATSPLIDVESIFKVIFKDPDFDIRKDPNGNDQQLAVTDEAEFWYQTLPLTGDQKKIAQEFFLPLAQPSDEEEPLFSELRLLMYKSEPIMAVLDNVPTPHIPDNMVHTNEETGRFISTLSQGGLGSEASQIPEYAYKAQYTPSTRQSLGFSLFFTATPSPKEKQYMPGYGVLFLEPDYRKLTPLFDHVRSNHLLSSKGESDIFPTPLAYESIMIGGRFYNVFRGAYSPKSRSSLLMLLGLKPTPGSTVIDVGTGMGFVGMEAVERREANKAYLSDKFVLEVGNAHANAHQSVESIRAAVNPDIQSVLEEEIDPSGVTILHADLFEGPMSDVKGHHIYFDPPSETIPIKGITEPSGRFQMFNLAPFLRKFFHEAPQKFLHDPDIQNTVVVAMHENANIGLAYEAGLEPVLIEFTDLPGFQRVKKIDGFDFSSITFVPWTEEGKTRFWRLDELRSYWKLIMDFKKGIEREVIITDESLIPLYQRITTGEVTDLKLISMVAQHVRVRAKFPSGKERLYQLRQFIIEKLRDLPDFNGLLVLKVLNDFIDYMENNGDHLDPIPMTRLNEHHTEYLNGELKRVERAEVKPWIDQLREFPLTSPSEEGRWGSTQISLLSIMALFPISFALLGFYIGIENLPPFIEIIQQYYRQNILQTIGLLISGLLMALVPPFVSKGKPFPHRSKNSATYLSIAKALGQTPASLGMEGEWVTDVLDPKKPVVFLIDQGVDEEELKRLVKEFHHPAGAVFVVETPTLADQFGPIQKNPQAIVLGPEHVAAFDNNMILMEPLEVHFQSDTAPDKLKWLMEGDPVFQVVKREGGPELNFEGLTPETSIFLKEGTTWWIMDELFGVLEKVMVPKVRDLFKGFRERLQAA
ncbi:hypothetical protein BVX98_02135 [bacterium F11]|nr:hypothetical protein BVX98_02135 [bacterium F11]